MKLNKEMRKKRNIEGLRNMWKFKKWSDEEDERKIKMKDGEGKIVNILEEMEDRVDRLKKWKGRRSGEGKENMEVEIVGW